MVQEAKAIMPCKTKSERKEPTDDVLSQESATELQFHGLVVLYVGIIALSCVILISFSGVAGVGYHTFDALLKLAQLWPYFLFSGFVGAIVLHAVNWYVWPSHRIAIAGVATLYPILVGIALNAKWYPAAPLLVVFLHIPAFLGFIGYSSTVRSRVSPRAFHKHNALCCIFVSLTVLLVWIMWVIAEDVPWNGATKSKLHQKLQEVFAAYKIADWTACEEERALTSGGNTTIRANCSRIELITFILWMTPCIEVIILVVLAAFSALRFWVVSSSASSREVHYKLILFILGIFGTGFWIACSTAGASMGLAQIFLASLGITSICFCVWIFFAVDINHLVARAQDTVIFKITSPILHHDYAFALGVATTTFLGLAFFALEFLVRRAEICFHVDGSGHKYLTERALKVASAIRRRHCASILEKSFYWNILYLVFDVFSRFTPVFLSKLGDILATMEFYSVCIIFYVVGLVMFLLPPVPGVPVYMAAGTIVVARGKQESWLNFWTGCLFASVLSLVLKLNAVAVQQKGIGEGCGRFLYIQQLVGVHTTAIRAIEKILSRPGLSLEKVAILCGGPDWPTSVLTGILKLNLCQMILGTLPCFFLIVPCVLGGATLTETNLRSVSPVIIMMVGVSQGAVLLAALIFIAQETERSRDELTQERPEHAVLVQRMEKSKRQAQLYLTQTEWRKLTVLQKTCLLLAVFLENMACLASFFLGSLFYTKFSMGSSFKAELSQGGLNNNVLNMVTSEGWGLLLMIAVGLCSFLLYKCITRPSEGLKVHCEEACEGNNS